MSLGEMFFWVMFGAVIFMVVTAIWAELEEQHTLFEEDEDDE
jgi:hypothetical protein